MQEPLENLSLDSMVHFDLKRFLDSNSDFFDALAHPSDDLLLRTMMANCKGNIWVICPVSNKCPRLHSGGLMEGETGWLSSL